MNPGNPTLRRVSEWCILGSLVVLVNIATWNVEGFWPNVGIYAIWAIGLLGYIWNGSLAKRGQKASADQ